MEMKNSGKTIAQIMLSAGWNGPGFRSYLALQGGEEAVITALLKDIDKGIDSDPDNQPLDRAAHLPTKKRKSYRKKVTVVDSFSPPISSTSSTSM